MKYPQNVQAEEGSRTVFGSRSTSYDFAPPSVVRTRAGELVRLEKVQSFWEFAVDRCLVCDPKVEYTW